MVTDQQVRMLRRMIEQGKSLASSAAKSEMSENTARRYLRSGLTPSESAPAHTWRTRPDPFAEDWERVRELLEAEPGLQARTVFEWLKEQRPGRFQDGQLRTLQRRIKAWRATAGPPREVFFPQERAPGAECQSDFTCMNALGVTIRGRPFEHLVYHFVLPYSNWETVTVVFSESFEALSLGLQNALWTLGGVPHAHQTDRLSAAVDSFGGGAQFRSRYEALLGHYGLEGRRIRTRKANENGDVEQRHFRLKRDAVDQALMLRGSRDFESEAHYEAFLKGLEARLNAGREARLLEEKAALGPLPDRRLETCTRTRVRVSPSSTIQAARNTYSVHSRLIGEQVEVRLYMARVEVWYGQKRIETTARLRGERRHRIDYRHVIDWLVRKPGAFAGYRYRDELFPTSRFRMVWDQFRRQRPLRADREYLRILHLAAREGEDRTDDALRYLLETLPEFGAQDVEEIVLSRDLPPAPEPMVGPVNLETYDALLEPAGEAGA